MCLGLMCKGKNPLEGELECDFKYKCECVVCWVAMYKNKAKTLGIVRNLLQVMSWPQLLLCKRLVHILYIYYDVPL